MSLQEPSHYAEDDMVLVAGSDYVRMASIGGGVLSIKLPTSSDSTPVVESIVGGGQLAVNGGTYVDAQRLGALYMRESNGTTVPNSNYVMTYNPNGNPLKEITYSDDIPNHLNIIDASLNSSTIAIGSGSNATGTNSVAIGNNASTSTYDNSVALGNGTACSDGNQIKIGNSSSAYQMEGRLNLVNSTTDSLISYGSSVKMYRSENGLTIGNYGSFAVQVADTTAEPTTVPTSRAGLNAFYINNEGRAWLGNSENTKSVRIRSANIETYISGYTTAGNVSTIGTGGQLSVSSDRRLKENIETYDEASIDKIMKLKPSYYNWIKGTDKRKELGFIAQDVETIIPEAVDGKKYEYEWKKAEEGEPILDASGNIQFTDIPRYRGLLDRPLIAVLVKAVQEQQEIIETEKTKTETLETKVSSLESQLSDVLSRLSTLENS